MQRRVQSAVQINTSTSVYRFVCGPHAHTDAACGFVFLRTLLRPWLLWAWLLRASRVAPLERSSDCFREHYLAPG
jgi:hypothetical protein